MFLPHCMLCSRNSLMSSHRSSDGDKLTPSQTYSSSRGPMGLDVRQHHHNLLTQHHNNHNDDDDKLLDVVGPPHSPLLSSLQQMQSQAQGEYKLRLCHGPQSSALMGWLAFHLSLLSFWNVLSAAATRLTTVVGSRATRSPASFRMHAETNWFTFSHLHLIFLPLTWQAGSILQMIRISKMWGDDCRPPKIMSVTAAIPIARTALARVEVAALVAAHFVQPAPKVPRKAHVPPTTRIHHQIYPLDHQFNLHHIYCLISIHMECTITWRRHSHSSTTRPWIPGSFWTLNWHSRHNIRPFSATTRNMRPLHRHSTITWSRTASHPIVCRASTINKVQLSTLSHHRAESRALSMEIMLSEAWARVHLITIITRRWAIDHRAYRQRPHTNLLRRCTIHRLQHLPRTTWTMESTKWMVAAAAAQREITTRCQRNVTALAAHSRNSKISRKWWTVSRCIRIRMAIQHQQFKWTCRAQSRRVRWTMMNNASELLLRIMITDTDS